MMLLLAFLLAGCSADEVGNSSSSAGATINSVAISCASSSVQVTHVVQCSDSVQGTGAFSSAVSWAEQGGGTISSSGLYTAPNVAPSPSQITVIATSIQDVTKSASATITVNPRTSLVFQTPLIFSTGGSTPNKVQAADLNGDGKLDLVITNELSNNVAVLIGKGDGTFQPAVTYSLDSGTFPTGLALADFNNDGKPDIAVANALVGMNGGTVSVLLNRGDGTFASPVDSGTNISPFSLAAGDLNKDGNQDLWVGGNGSSAILLGKGNGTFNSPVSNSMGPASGVAIADFNGDGLPDLIAAIVSGPSSSGSVAVSLNQGNGVFGSPSGASVGNAPFGIAVGDFNRDGKLDLAVTNSATGSVTISVLLGNGNGTLQPQMTFVAGNSPGPLAAADFQGSGKLGLVVGTEDAALPMPSNAVRVSVGNGDGTFTGGTTIATGTSPLALTVGDFNSDGAPDVAVVDSVTNTVSIALLTP